MKKKRVITEQTKINHNITRFRHYLKSSLNSVKKVYKVHVKTKPGPQGLLRALDQRNGYNTSIKLLTVKNSLASKINDIYYRALKLKAHKYLHNKFLFTSRKLLT